jgi:hypothetical protein
MIMPQTSIRPTAGWLQGRGGLLDNGQAIASGAQTGRPGDARPMRVVLGG